MKVNLPLKLAIGITATFGLLLIGIALFPMLQFRYYECLLLSENKENRWQAFNYFVNQGSRGHKTIEAFCRKNSDFRWGVPDNSICLKIFISGPDNDKEHNECCLFKTKSTPWESNQGCFVHKKIKNIGKHDMQGRFVACGYGEQWIFELSEYTSAGTSERYLPTLLGGAIGIFKIMGDGGVFSYVPTPIMWTNNFKGYGIYFLTVSYAGSLSYIRSGKHMPNSQTKIYPKLQSNRICFAILPIE